VLGILDVEVSSNRVPFVVFCSKDVCVMTTLIENGVGPMGVVCFLWGPMGVRFVFCGGRPTGVWWGPMGGLFLVGRNGRGLLGGGDYSHSHYLNYMYFFSSVLVFSSSYESARAGRGECLCVR
jgi:hypothetical protein